MNMHVHFLRCLVVVPLLAVFLPANESYRHMEDIAFGVAQDDDGNDKPVVWTFDAGLQTWNPLSNYHCSPAEPRV